MNSKRKDKEQTNRKGNTVLVAVDFSPCSVVALRRARTILGQKPGRILVLHVIDQDFIVRCIHNRLGTEEHIKKTLYLRARDKLKTSLRSTSGQSKVVLTWSSWETGETRGTWKLYSSEVPLRGS